MLLFSGYLEVIEQDAFMCSFALELHFTSQLSLGSFSLKDQAC